MSTEKREPPRPPQCFKCGGPTNYLRRMPGALNGQPEQEAYQCTQCKEFTWIPETVLF
jgi:hypothetical protein